jgi:hypothetical protein
MDGDADVFVVCGHASPRQLQLKESKIESIRMTAKFASPTPYCYSVLLHYIDGIASLVVHCK